MAFFDIAFLGIVIPIVGWGIQRIECLRHSHQSMDIKVSNLQGQQEILKADLMSKLDILIFRVRALEARFEENQPD